MEDLLEENIIAKLKYMYNVNNDDYCLRYFFMRYMIYKHNTNLDNEEVINFLFRELGIKDTNTLVFNDAIIKKLYFGYDDSVESIIDNWKFKILDKEINTITNETITIKEYLINLYNDYKNKGKSEIKGNSKDLYYDYALRHLMLLYSYNDFNIKEVFEPGAIKGLKNCEVDSYITIDVELQRYFSTFNMNKYNSEKELEDHIYYTYNKTNNNLFLNEINIIGRQVRVKSGIIDLLGKDKDNNYVVIELKVNNRPKDLFYQYKAYTSNIKEIYKTNRVRFIAITPALSYDILEEIKTENIELYYHKKNINEYNFQRIL